MENIENVENMENKESKEQTVTSAYYTPDITDLHVGYECEFVPHGRMVGEPDNAYKWDKITLTQDTTNVWSDKWSDLIKRFYIRTPYLTREQIEAEGWEEREQKEGEIKFWKPCFVKGPYQLFFHKRLEISGPNISYLGECKSINEFRKIIKWLGL
jgi:hypothetical protein